MISLPFLTQARFKRVSVSLRLVFFMKRQTVDFFETISLQILIANRAKPLYSSFFFRVSISQVSICSSVIATCFEWMNKGMLNCAPGTMTHFGVLSLISSHWIQGLIRPYLLSVVLCLPDLAHLPTSAWAVAVNERWAWRHQHTTVEMYCLWWVIFLCW